MAEGVASDRTFLVLARFFCEYFRVTDVRHIDPRQGRTEAWMLMGRPHILGVEVGSVYHGPGSPAPQPMQFALDAPSFGQRVACPLPATTRGDARCRYLSEPAGDLAHVCLLGAVLRGVWSSVPVKLAVRFPFYPVGDQGAAEAMDRMVAAADGVPSAFLTFGATPKEGREVEAVAVREDLSHGFLNRYAAATLALVNERNLGNGIIAIPHAVCAEAGLPVFRGIPPPPTELEDNVPLWEELWTRKNEGRHRIQQFFAVPVNHVLAWALRDETYAARKRLPSLKFRYMSPEAGATPVTAYYLVADLHMDQLRSWFCAHWMGKVDMRPLSSLSFEFVPDCERSHYPDLPADVRVVQGVATVRSYLTYMTPQPGLTQEGIDALIPTLCPAFPEPTGWIPYDEEEMTFIAGLQQRVEHSVAKRK